MEQNNGSSRQKPSNSRGQNGANSQREEHVGDKDISNRRKCPECDGRLSKENGKSKSRVWKKVMWFTRRSKAAKNDICQCRITEEGFNCNVDDRHSNSWSFTRSASRKFRSSSRKRQCKSESLHVHEKHDEACTSYESSLPSTRTGSICSSGANSPTATGSFCDFGATSHAGGRGSKRQKNTFVLTEIAREINPPVKNNDLPLPDSHPPPKRLSKSSSSVSHISRRCTTPMLGTVRRSKSFPGSHGHASPSKRRLINTPNTAFGSSSPPVKQKCYGLRRTATFSGQLNTGTEFSKMCLKKSKSVNCAELTKLEKSTSLGEIRDQSGSVVGVVHFYKSPKKLARRLSSFIHEVKKDCVFEEEEVGCEAVDQTSSNVISVSQEGSQACSNKISESRRDASLLPELSTFNETNKRDFDATSKDEIITSSDSPPPLEMTPKTIESDEAVLNLSNIDKEINDVCSNKDKPTLCDNKPNVSNVLYNNKPIQELGFDLNDEPNNSKNVGGNNYVDNDDNEADVSSVVNNNDSFEEMKNINGNKCINTTDSVSKGLFGSVTKQEIVIENVSDIEKIMQHECGSMRSESLSSTLLNKDETTNISNLETDTSELLHDDRTSVGSYHKNDLLTEQSSTSAPFQEIPENVESGNCHRCSEPPSLLATSEQTSDHVDLPCHHGDHMSNNCEGCVHHHGNHLVTEPPSIPATLEQTSEDVKLPCHDAISDNDNGNHLLTKDICVSSKPHQGLEVLQELAVETEGEIVSNASEQYTDGVAKIAPNSCGLDVNEICVDDASLLKKSDDSFSSNNASQSSSTTDNCLECEISVDGTGNSLLESTNDSVYSNDTCLSNNISCGDSSSLECEITEQLDSLKAPPDERDFCNDAKLSHNCACVMPENDLTLKVFNNKFNTDNNATPVVPYEKFQMRVHSSVITSPEINNPSSPTRSLKSANDPVDMYTDSPTKTKFSSQNCENIRNVATPVTSSREKLQMRRHSSATTSPEILESSRTSDYLSMFDESFSPRQNDVPIHTWKTSESDLKSDEIGLPVPGETFKIRTEVSNCGIVFE